MAKGKPSGVRCLGPDVSYVVAVRGPTAGKASSPMELLICAALALLALLMLFLAWRHWKLRRRCRARLAKDGVQELEIIVQGKFRPSTVFVKKGIPARLLFNRQEDDPCSQRVIIPGLRQDRWLPPFATTAVQFIPSRPGEYLVTCSLGMYLGKLVVEE